MDIHQAIDQLRQWCDRSNGTPIEIAPGQTAVFLTRSVHDANSVRMIEDRLGCSLPDSYRLFMATIGASSLFSWSPHGGGPRFYNPEEVIEASIAVATQQDVGRSERFCFVGEHRLMGDLMGFLVSRSGPKNFDVYCHEYPVEEYAGISDEIRSWRTFEEWLIHAVETYGVESI
jgi:hypothetical protein